MKHFVLRDHFKEQDRLAVLENELLEKEKSLCQFQASNVKSNQSSNLNSDSLLPIIIKKKKIEEKKQKEEVEVRFKCCY